VLAVAHADARRVSGLGREPARLRATEQPAQRESAEQTREDAGLRGRRHLASTAAAARAGGRARSRDADFRRSVRGRSGATGSGGGDAGGPEEWRRLFREIAHEPSPMRERDTALVALAYAGV
jgi:hypothetical protein